IRRQELVATPGRALRAIQRLSVAAERLASRVPRAGMLERLRVHIRFELRATRFTSLSPVSGLLNVIALHAAHTEDGDARRALDAREDGMGEAGARGTRAAAARSATWDSGLAAQTLAATGEHEPVAETLVRVGTYLATQQIRSSWPDARRFHRTDPRG